MSLRTSTEGGTGTSSGKERLAKFLKLLKQKKLDSYLVTKDVNIRYLTDFPASESWLFVTSPKIYYITDFRYILEAKKGLKNILVVRYTKSTGDTLFKTAFKRRIKTIGFDERHMSVSVFRKLKKSLKNKIRLVPCNNLVESLREVKNSYEVARIRKALNFHGQAYRYLREVIKPSKTEGEVFSCLDEFVKKRGARFSFDPIIASGPNSCFPHAHVTDRRIRNNEIVLVDIGMEVAGYKSDLTRIFFLGKIPPLVKKVYQIVAAAQKKAIAKIKATAMASNIDKEARNYLTKNRLGKFFGHSLGHGVGLEIHEAPAISSKSPSILKEGMVITVEPAVYIPNKFGIRIEDMVLVTKDGCEILSRQIP